MIDWGTVTTTPHAQKGDLPRSGLDVDPVLASIAGLVGRKAPVGIIPYGLSALGRLFSRVCMYKQKGPVFERPE